MWAHSLLPNQRCWGFFSDWVSYLYGKHDADGIYAVTESGLDVEIILFQCWTLCFDYLLDLSVGI